MELDFRRPGKTTDNGLNEAFNGRFRQECLNESWFLSLEDALEKVEEWRQHYNLRDLMGPWVMCLRLNFKGH